MHQSNHSYAHSQDRPRILNTFRSLQHLLILPKAGCQCYSESAQVPTRQEIRRIRANAWLNHTKSECTPKVSFHGDVFTCNGRQASRLRQMSRLFEPQADRVEYFHACISLVPTHRSDVVPNKSSSVGRLSCVKPDPIAENMSTPRFFQQPFRFLRWASHERPSLFYACIMGGMGPILLIVDPPIKRYFGIERRPAIPLTYPSTVSLVAISQSPNLAFNVQS